MIFALPFRSIEVARTVHSVRWSRGLKIHCIPECGFEMIDAEVRYEEPKIKITTKITHNVIVGIDSWQVGGSS